MLYCSLYTCLIFHFSTGLNYIIQEKSSYTVQIGQTRNMIRDFFIFQLVKKISITEFIPCK